MASVSAGNDLLGVREITVGVVFTALAIAAVSGRLWARNLKKTPAEASDYLIVVALVSGFFYRWCNHTDRICSFSLSL